MEAAAAEVSYFFKLFMMSITVVVTITTPRRKKKKLIAIISTPFRFLATFYASSALLSYGLIIYHEYIKVYAQNRQNY